MQEAILKHYVDEIWTVYDKSQDGFLSREEIVPFFNDLFVRVGENKTYSEKDIDDFFKTSDTNNDGKISKEELKEVLKAIWAKNPFMGTATTYEKPPAGFVYENHKKIVETKTVTTITTTEIVHEYFGEIWGIYDEKNSGYISVKFVNSFVNDFMNRVGEKKTYSEEEIKAYFEKAGVEYQGDIDKASLLKVLNLMWSDSSAKNTVTTYVAPNQGYTYTYHVQNVQNDIFNQYWVEIWNVYDSEGKGRVPVTQTTNFVNDFVHRLGGDKVYTQEELRIIFEKAGVPFDGNIDRESLQKVLHIIWTDGGFNNKVTKYVAPTETVTYTYYITERQNNVLNGYTTEIWNVYDSGNNGKITITQTTNFVNDFVHRLGGDKVYTQEELRIIFEKAGVPFDGNIDRESLQKVLYIIWTDGGFNNKIITYVAPTETVTYTYYITERQNNVLDGYTTEIWNVYDSGNNGKVTVTQTTNFVNDFVHRLGGDKVYTQEELRVIFEKAGVPFDGNIDRESLQKVLHIIWTDGGFNNKVTTYVAPTETVTYAYYITERQNNVLDGYTTEIWNVYDSGNNGKVTVTQTISFVNDFVQRLGGDKVYTEEEIRILFEKAGVPYNGEISRESLQRVLHIIWTDGGFNNKVTTYIAPPKEHKYTHYTTTTTTTTTTSTVPPPTTTSTKVEGQTTTIISESGKSETVSPSTATSITTSIKNKDDVVTYNKTEIQTDLDPVLKQYVEEIWQIYDRNGDGYLSFTELAFFFNDLFARSGDGRTYTTQQILEFFHVADSNKDGRVDKMELYRLLEQLNKSKPYQGRKEYIKASESELENYSSQRNKRIVTTTTTITKGGETITYGGSGQTVITTSGNLGGETITYGNSGSLLTGGETITYVNGSKTTNTQNIYQGSVDNVFAQYIEEIWNIYDRNNDGYLSVFEMSDFFNDLFARTGDNRQLTAEETLALFKQADTNQDSRVDRRELLKVLPLVWKNKPYQGKVTTYVAPEKDYQYKYYTSGNGGSRRVVTTTTTVTRTIG